MELFRNILFVADNKTNGEGAFERAVALARTNQAQLTVVDVLEELPQKMKTLTGVVSPSELQTIAKEERFTQLEHLIAPIRDEGIEVNAKVLIGTPFIEIIREVLRSKHDLVMKAAQGIGGRRARLFGSIDQNLMRKCPCPVWIMKPAHSKQYARILAAVDPDPYDDERNALNIKIMDLATSLAKLEKSELHIVHAWTLYGESMLRYGLTRLPENEVDRLVRDARNLRKGWLDELLRNYNLDDIEHRVHLLKGQAGMVIPDLAYRKRIDLIVMGTVCRTGLPGFLIGNTAETVLSQVDCSVLTVKPYGFLSPVGLE